MNRKPRKTTPATAEPDDDCRPRICANCQRPWFDDRDTRAFETCGRCRNPLMSTAAATAASEVPRTRTAGRLAWKRKGLPRLPQPGA